MCKDALHLGHAFRHCLTIGLPQVRRVYARGNRFAASARARRVLSCRLQTEHASMHGMSRISRESVRRGMLDFIVRRGMLGVAELARRTRWKRLEHASAHGTDGIWTETVHRGILGAACRRPDQKTKLDGLDGGGRRRAVPHSTRAAVKYEGDAIGPQRADA